MIFRCFIAGLLILLAVPAWAAVDQSLLKGQEAGSALLRGDFDKAIELYDEALSDTTLPAVRLATLYNDRGVAQWRRQKLELAIEDFNKAAKLYPDYAPIYNNRGNVYLALGKIKEAIADFTKAISLAPAYGAAYNNRGNAYLITGDHEAAEADFRKAVQLMPTNAVPLNGRGKAAGLLGRPYAGLRYISRALLLNRNYPAAYHNRALVYMHVEQYSDAISDLDKMLSINKDDPELLVLRGRANAETGKHKTALSDFSKAIEADPENAEAYAGRGASELKLGIVEQALEDCNQAAALSPELVSAYLCRAEAYLKLDQAEEVSRNIEKVLELSPNIADAYRIRAILAEGAGETEAAIADYRRALELDPFMTEAKTALAKLVGEDDLAVDSAITTIGGAFKGWKIVSPGGRTYVAINDRYPKLRVLLEMYGEGQAEILDWTPLTETLRGFGLLRYFAGERAVAGSNEKKRYEYVAILDLKKNKVVSIEPFLSGGEKAKWEWGKYEVTITDVDGVPSAHQLRKPPPKVVRRQPRETERDEFAIDRWFRGDEGRWRRDRRRRRNPTLFDWLFR